MADRSRRQRGEGAVFKRSDGRYVAMIELKPGPEGQRRRKTVYGTSTADVIKKMGKLRRQRDDMGDLVTSDQTVEQWLTYWLEEICGPKLKPSTLAGYTSVVSQRLVPSLGKRRLSDLGPEHVRSMHKKMAEQGLAASTANQAHRVLAAALGDALKWGRVPRNVARVVDAPSVIARPERGLALDEALRVLTLAAKDNTHGSTWFAALMLGLRQGERLGLRWSSVDLDAGTIDVEWSLQRVPVKAGVPQVRTTLEHVLLDGTMVLVRPKTNRSRRVVPLPAVVWRALEHRSRVAELERPHYEVDHDLVWCRPDGRPIHPRFDYDVWQALLTGAGVGHHTLHEARNTAVTMLYDAGTDEQTVAMIAGHSNVGVTRGYRRVPIEARRAALDAVGARLALNVD